MLFDVDHFKKVNDTYGHPIGDLVLVEISKVVRREVRNEDVVARYGGEEFALILRGIDITGSRSVGERLRAQDRAARRQRRQGAAQGDGERRLRLDLDAPRSDPRGPDPLGRSAPLRGQARRA